MLFGNLVYFQFNLVILIFLVSNFLLIDASDDPLKYCNVSGLVYNETQYLVETLNPVAFSTDYYGSMGITVTKPEELLLVQMKGVPTLFGIKGKAFKNQENEKELYSINMNRSPDVLNEFDPLSLPTDFNSPISMVYNNKTELFYIAGYTKVEGASPNVMIQVINMTHVCIFLRDTPGNIINIKALIKFNLLE